MGTMFLTLLYQTIKNIDHTTLLASKETILKTRKIILIFILLICVCVILGSLNITNI